MDGTGWLLTATQGRYRHSCMTWKGMLPGGPWQQFCRRLPRELREQWVAIPRNGNTATVYFKVRNTTDMNSFLHPEVTSKYLAEIFYPNAHPLFTSLNGL